MARLARTNCGGYRMAKIKMKLSEMTLDQLRAKQARIEKIIDKRMQERLALLASIPAPIGAWTVDDNDGLSDFEGIEVLHDQYSFLNDDGDAGVTPILPRTTRMKITIVTLHRVEMEEHFVGAVEGRHARQRRFAASAAAELAALLKPGGENGRDGNGGCGAASATAAGTGAGKRVVARTPAACRLPAGG